MAPAKSLDVKDLVLGGLLQCTEAITCGMPFEVWKTRMGTNRSLGTIEAFKGIYQEGGAKAFWKGWQPKMVESFLKGGILLFSKEGIIRACKTFGIGDIYSGLIGGFGGGVSQVVVLGPCTFLVTAAVQGKPAMETLSSTYKSKGISGFYAGGTALMLRQGSNWASRQGFTDVIRKYLLSRHEKGTKSKLSAGEEALSGVIGGMLSTWNQPFEVLRIQAQAAGARGEAAKGIVATSKQIYKESGLGGFFKGIYPRMGLCVAQTFFMITVPYLMKDFLGK